MLLPEHLQSQAAHRLTVRTGSQNGSKAPGRATSGARNLLLPMSDQQIELRSTKFHNQGSAFPATASQFQADHRQLSAHLAFGFIDQHECWRKPTGQSGSNLGSDEQAFSHWTVP